MARPSAWRARRRDARLTTASPPAVRRTRPPSDRRLTTGAVIRNIRLLGIALGGLIGLALARPAGLLLDTPAGGLEITPLGGIWLIAWIVAWLVVGFAILPYLTVVPASWLFRAVQEPLRLGPRYVKTNLAFAAILAKAWWQRRHPGGE